jgi:hypothetical protein
MGRTPLAHDLTGLRVEHDDLARLGGGVHPGDQLVVSHDPLPSRAASGVVDGKAEEGGGPPALIGSGAAD